MSEKQIREATAQQSPVSDPGPFLIIAAFWQPTDNTDAVAQAVRSECFPDVPGYSRGVVVAFRREVADARDFRRDLGRFNLEELNERPAFNNGDSEASPPSSGSASPESTESQET